MITKCGDDCAYCPRFVTEQNGRSPAALSEAKDLWTRLELKGRDLPVERLACRGCQPENDCAHPELRACVTARGYENCGSCDEYPCPRTAAVFAKTRELEIRAKRICTPAELQLLRKAFFSKRVHLDGVHQFGQGGMASTRQRCPC